MDKIGFTSNSAPSLGIEIELALVDAQTMELSNSIQSVLDRVPAGLEDHIKPELMQSYVEINTGVCDTVDEAEADLLEKLLVLQNVTDDLGLRLYWSGTHPFSHWRDQRVTPTERYEKLVDLLQDMARQLVCFGLHVHVGVDSGDKAVMICDRIMRHLPTLLAISSNSPWWENRVSGLRSHRAKIMEGLPTAGLPPLMRNWSEYVWLARHLIETGFIYSIREIWWDVRPHHNFGTVEVRMCDVTGNLDDALALSALIQCLVQALSNAIDRGTYQHDCHPMMVRQNKWRACRFGLEAELIDPLSFEPRDVRQIVAELVEDLAPVAEELGCAPWLGRLLAMSRGKSWAHRQLDMLKETGSPAEVVRHFTEQSRLVPKT
ncbi:MAG: YbdK family carboxylate-amine ligase [Planctomycetota bacterium]|nr:MAG: YbdK family carboxylate-amine ligase [Planctomycetota bacterium]